MNKNLEKLSFKAQNKILSAVSDARQLKHYEVCDLTNLQTSIDQTIKQAYELGKQEERERILEELEELIKGKYVHYEMNNCKTVIDFEQIKQIINNN